MSVDAGPLRANVHATGLLLGDIGVLLRGASSSGKSLLALELLDRHALRRVPAFLVADDRVDLVLENGRITMHAPRAIAGLIELRGRGIVSRPFVAAAPLHLVVDLVDQLVRMVEETALQTNLLGITLPRCPVPYRSIVDASHQLLLVAEAVAAVRTEQRAREQETT